MNTAPNGYHCDIGAIDGGAVNLIRCDRDFVLFFTRAKLPKCHVRTTRSETRLVRRCSDEPKVSPNKYV